MYVDKLLLLSDEQIICNAASEYSENVIDLGAAKNLAKGTQLYVVVVIDVTIASVTSINFQVVTDDSATLAGSTVQVESGAILQASLTANRAPIVIPVGSVLNIKEQYLGVYYVLAGSVNATGKVTTFVAFDTP